MESTFSKFAKEAGPEILAITITYFCKKWLGLPDDITWCDGTDDELADGILERIFLDGNFGGERSITEGIKRNIDIVGMFKHLQSTGMVHWKAAQKYKILRPFAWAYQVFRYGWKGIVDVRRGEKVFRKEKPRMKIEEIWERLE